MLKESLPERVKEVTDVIGANYLLKTARDIDEIHGHISPVSPSPPWHHQLTEGIVSSQCREELHS